MEPGSQADASPARRPSQAFYAVALAVALAGTGAFAYVIFAAVSAAAGSLTQIVVPGRAEVRLSRPGRHIIFHEHKSVAGGRVYSGEGGLPGLRVEVRAVPGGALIPLSPPKGKTSYELGARSGASLFEFSAAEPGAVEISASYPGGQGPEAVLAVAPDFTCDLAKRLLKGLAVFGASWVAALAIAILTFHKRGRAG